MAKDPGIRGKKTIVITGCSSGFGRVTALHLARLGWLVLATVRKESDREYLLKSAELDGSLENMVVFLCDITDQAQVAALADDVRSYLTANGLTPSLDVLLNNAGTGYGGPLELIPIDAIRAQFEVNVFAHIVVTQAFLPLLKAARGMILNVSSVNGRLSVPALGPYAASKFALEAISDAWRMELAPLGVRVVVIEPASSPTDIWDVSLKRVIGYLGDEFNNSPYRPLLQSTERMVRQSSKSGFPIQKFADVVFSIVCNPRPRARYQVPSSATLMVALRYLPDRVWDWIARSTMRW